MIVGFDVDGTLCTTPAGTNYDDPQSLLARCRPRLGVLRHVQDLVAAGHQVRIVTQRPPAAAPATLQQLALWLPDARIPAMHVAHRSHPRFSIKRYVEDKRRSLVAFGCSVYVGDRVEDQAAAAAAGLQFHWDHEWEQHGLRLLDVAVAP